MKTEETINLNNESMTDIELLQKHCKYFDLGITPYEAISFAKEYARIKVSKGAEKKTGIELIAQERAEQIEKHGFSLDKDAEFYEGGELQQAARYCLGADDWPTKWHPFFADKIANKDLIGRLKVAGAFLVAEIDRLLTPAKDGMKEG